ncbi:hypothetical protein EC968_007548 [Mortierella alpina]|nr:hypothetical protein EC968_007548 [Mortierella alpina]
MLASKVVPADQKSGEPISLAPSSAKSVPETTEYAAQAHPENPAKSSNPPVTPTTKSGYRTRLPLTISTHPTPLNSGSTVSNELAPSPRSAGVRRKPVAMPSVLSPSFLDTCSQPAADSEKKLLQVNIIAGRNELGKEKCSNDLIILSDEVSAIPNGVQKVDDDLFDVNTIASCNNTDAPLQSTNGGSLGSAATNGKAKRRISFNRPGVFIKTLGRNSTATSGASSSSSARSDSSRSNSVHVGSNGSGGSVGQKFGDFLGISGSLLGSKKRGSNASMKARGGTSSTPSPSPSASSISKDAVSPSSGTPKSPGFLLTALFGGGDSGSRQGSLQQSLGVNPARRGTALWSAIAVGEDDNDHRVESWEMNKSLPPAGYADESFGLWIRPKERARTVINGQDVEEAEAVCKSEGGYRGNAVGEESSLGHFQKIKKRACVELEDMQVLEEVLDFSIIILMRASAALYSFIAKAHANSMPINLSWILLQYKDRGFKTYNVRTLKEYQDIVMADIGLAVQAINEIFDQQERPHGHPDNLSRDSKPQTGHSKSPSVPSFPVTLPPSKQYQTVNIKGSTSTRLPRRSKQTQVPQLTPTSPTPGSPPPHHRRRSSVSNGRPSLSSVISSIKQSLPSPSTLHSPHQHQYSSYPDGTPFFSPPVPTSAPLSYSQAGSTDQQLQLHLLLAQSFNSNNSCNNNNINNNNNNNNNSSSSSSHGNNGGFLPQSIQNIFSSFRTSPNSPNSATTPGHVTSPSSAPPTLSKQEEKRLHLEHRWRVDILRRKAHLRGWACRNFLALYEYSIRTSSSSPTSPLAFSCSLEHEFRDLYRIIHAIVQVDATATDRSHEILEAALAEAREHEMGPSFRLQYSRYKTKAPTAKEIRALHLEAAKRFEAQHAEEATDVQSDSRRQSESDGGSMNLTLDDCVAPFKPITSQKCTAGSAPTAVNADDPARNLGDTDEVSAYDCMEFYGLQGHPVWEPLLDRLTKFDTTHHSLDARNVHQFLRRMSLLSPSVVGPESLLSNAARDELLAVLWVLERCVSERKDFQQSPTWFRMSSSASAVQEIYNAGGVIPYLKVLRKEDAQGRDPIHTVHPVTLTGYFKRLLKDCGGLLMKEVTALFVELTSPSTDNGEFWTLDKLTKIDRALLYRLICLDMNRGYVFLRISRVMEQILGSSPKDMELDAFALSKMVQVVELSGVLDLKALRRWNGAWSAIILGYM